MSNHDNGDRPPSPPRLRSTGLPDDIDLPAEESAPFLGGYPILLEDMDPVDLPPDVAEQLIREAYEESRASALAGTRDLVSELQDISSLRGEYLESSNPNFLAQIDELRNQGYKRIRRVKGDGDCFYRALAFAHIERLLRSSNKYEAITDLLGTEDDENYVRDEVRSIIGELALLDLTDSSANDEILKVFQDQHNSNYIVSYMRTLTSAQICSGDFKNFLALTEAGAESGRTIDAETFCRQFVDPLGKEADSVQVYALTQALKVYVKVAYLDGGQPKPHFHAFPEDAPNGHEALVLLYRPGHYDILQKEA